MATERLRVILEMVTGQYKRGAADAARATDGITKSGQTADRSVSRLDTTMKNFALVGGAAIVINRASKVITELDALGVRAEGLRNQFNTVFGESASDVREWADEVNGRFGESQLEVERLAASVGDLLVPLGFTREEAGELSKEVLTTANALSEFSGGQIEAADATGRIRKALLGERESLEALNIKVLQSQVNAELLRQGQANLTGEEKARAEALATLNIIQGQSADALSAYANGTNETLIKQKQANAAIDDARQKLGDFTKKELDPYRDTALAAAFATEDLVEWLESLTGASEDTDEAQESLTQRWLEALPIIGDDIRRVRELSEEYVQNSIQAENAATAVGGYEGRLQALGPAAEDAGEDLEGVSGETAKIARDAPLAAAGIRDLTSALAAQTSPVFRFLDALERYDKTLEEIDEDGERTADESTKLLEAFVDLAEAGANLDDSDIERFGELAVDVLSLSTQEAKDFIEQLEILTNRDWAINVVSNLPGTTFDRVAIEAEQAGTPLRAHGGAVAGGRAYIVGERGPELFTPSGSGRIQNDFQSVGAAGGDVNITVLIDGSRADFADEAIRQIDQKLQRFRSGGR